MNIFDEYINRNTNVGSIIQYFQTEKNFNDKVLNFLNLENIDYYKGEVNPRQNPPTHLTNYTKNTYNIIKKIIDFKAQNLFGKGIVFENIGDESDFEKFKKSWHNSKLTTHYIKLATSLFSYGKAAEIININKDKVEHIALEADKESFYAFFDNDGSLGAFSRFYKKEELVNNNLVLVDYADIYTNEYKYNFTKLNGNWVKLEPLKILKMPVVYYQNDFPITYILRNLQDSYNEIMNKISDVNNMVSYPFLLLVGEVLELSNEDLQDVPIMDRTKKILDKLNNGTLKAVNMTNDDGNSSFDIKTWNNKPETLIYELETVLSSLYKLSGVPDLSLQNLQDLPISNISGFALQILFIDSEIQKSSDFALFFELKRAINLHAEYINADVDVIAKTRSFMPNDDKTAIQNLVNLRAGGLISLQTSVEQNPYVNNAEIEVERMQSENETQINNIDAESYI